MRGERERDTLVMNKKLRFPVHLVILQAHFMFSSATIITLQYAAQQVTIYFGLFVFITGILGGLLNIVVFTTLVVFRQTSSGFYLTINSIANIGQLVAGALTRILFVGFQIDPAAKSWLCKLPLFLTTYFNIISSSSMCLATLDQFLSVARPRWSTPKLAHRLMTCTCVFWLGYSTLFLIYYDLSLGVCRFINLRFAEYYSRVHLLVISEAAPIVIIVTFALLASRYLRTLTHRQLDIVRQSHHRQLTTMVLVQAVFIVILTLPPLIFYVYTLNTSPTDLKTMARNQLITAIVNLTYFEGCSVRMSLYS